MTRRRLKYSLPVYLPLIILMAAALAPSAISGPASAAAALPTELPGSPTERNYYFPWYDAIGGSAWVLMSNPVSSGQDLDFGLAMAGQPMDLDPFAVRDAGCPGNDCPGGFVPPGTSITPSYGGFMGGPVKVSSRTGDEAIVSQRVLWNGRSLEEVPGIPEDELSDHYFWPWYDNQSAGMTNWVLVANPSGTASVDFTITVAGNQVYAGTLAPGQRAIPTFPGVMGGPVEVVATGKVISSQRVLSFGGTAFNEVPGIPEESLSSHYVWTWYDQQSRGAKNWVLIANPQDTQVYAEIRIAGQVVWEGTIAPRGNVTPVFPGFMGGPVEVEAWTGADRTAPASVLATQRSIWGQSFEEVPGYPESELAARYHWTWYDQRSAGSRNWVLIANPNQTQIICEIKVGGIVYWSQAIGPGQFVTPGFPWVMSGPVEVTSTGGPVIASQRVLWNGYFNETRGTVLKEQVPVEPEWVLRQMTSNPHPGDYVDEFLLRGIHGSRMYASSNAALWPDRAHGFEYQWINSVRQADMNAVESKAQFGFAYAPQDGAQGRIYLAGQAWFGDTPAASTRRRSLLTVWDLADDSFVNIEMNAPGKKTDNRNELVSLLDDGEYLIAGEAGGPADPNGDSDFPGGSGLWRIPKATIADAASWQRIYEEPWLEAANWHDLIKVNGTYFALQTAGKSHRLLASQNLTSWSQLWMEQTQNNQEARSNLLLDSSGKLLVVHERTGSDHLWVSVMEGPGWVHHQTGILTALPAGNFKSLDIAAAYDGLGRLLVIRGKGEAWNHTPALTDVFLVDTTDWSHRKIFADVPGWPMHQKRLAQEPGHTYFSTSYPGYMYRLENQ